MGKESMFSDPRSLIPSLHPRQCNFLLFLIADDSKLPAVLSRSSSDERLKARGIAHFAAVERLDEIA